MLLNKFIFIICVVSTLSMFNNRLISSGGLKSAIYALILFFIFWLWNLIFKQRQRKKKEKMYSMNKYIFFALFFVAISFIVGTPYSPSYSLFLKYIGYILCFYFGVYIIENGIPLKVNAGLLCFTLFLPLFLVGIIDKTPHKIMFFVLSNMYSYTGLAFSFLVYTVCGTNSKSFYWGLALLFAYILSCSSLGIVVAFVLALLFINRRNVRLMVASLIILTIIVLAVFYSNIEIFKRIRDVINIFLSLSAYDWMHLRDLDLYRVGQRVVQESGRDDNTSAIWRLIHWSALVEDFLKNWYYSFVLGLGDNYAHKVLGNYPHCEYLRFLCEYGFIVFAIMMKWINNLRKVVKKDKSVYFIVTFLFYCITENLIDTFVANAVMFFCIGVNYTRCKLNSPFNKISKNESSSN